MTYLTYKKGDAKPQRKPLTFGRFWFFITLAFLHHLGKLGQIALATIVIIYILKSFEILK
jgi:hypothetical protein